MSKENDALVEKIGDLHPRSSGLQRQGDVEDVAQVFLTVAERDLLLRALSILND